jgi:hypothetical protein
VLYSLSSFFYHRNTHGDREASTSEEFTFNTSRASLNTYVGGKY